MCQVLDCSLSIFYIICRTQLIISNINLLTNGKYNNHDIEKNRYISCCMFNYESNLYVNFSFIQILIAIIFGCRIIVVTKCIDILMKILIVHMCDIGFPQTF